jgi:hypothetical protein
MIIPMAVTTVQDYVAAGQFRGGGQLLNGGLEGVTAGSSCIVNAYTSNHEEIVAKETGTEPKIVRRVIEGLGLVHALLLRIQALLLPIKTPVLSSC